LIGVRIKSPVALRATMNRLFDHATIGVEHLRFEPDVAESEKPSS